MGNHLVDALKYFSQSLLLSSDKNTRSLFGVVMTINAMKARKSEIGKQEEEMIQQCTTKIVQNYADSKSTLMDTVKNVLLDLSQTDVLFTCLMMIPDDTTLCDQFNRNCSNVLM